MRGIKSFLKQTTPVILTVVGSIGVAATSVMAVRATPKALDILSSHADDEELSKKDVIKLTWRCYIPAALVGISTITCIAVINVFNKRRQASLASAYAMLNQSYKQYRKAANTVYGDDADSKIRAQAAKDTYVSADGYSLYSSDLDPESEKILCCDLFSQRYFTATMTSVLNAQYHINRNLCLRGNVSVNEFYEFLGIDKIDCGDEIGWSLEELIEGGLMWLDFNNSNVEMDDGMKCCFVSALIDPDILYYES